jgi:hypothetical protein
LSARSRRCRSCQEAAIEDRVGLPPEISDQLLAERYRARKEWLERAARDFTAVRAVAEAPGCPNVELVIRHLQVLLDRAADSDCLAREDRELIADKARGVARIAYQRFFEDLLERGQAIMRGESRARLDPLLTTAQELMKKLDWLQLDRATQEGLHTKIGILLETARAGDSARAKKGERLKPRPFNQDQRLFVRYGEPTLIVRLADVRYRNPNWGLGGLLLTGVPRAPGGTGSFVDLHFCIEGGRVHEERAAIVWYAADGRLGLQLRRFGSQMVSLKQELEARRIVPRA